MFIHLIRHAHAGSRSKWSGEDHLRPLSSRGEKQSAALANQLAAAGIQELWSSPYIRCCQTLDPLSGRIGVQVTGKKWLGEGAAGDEAFDALLAAAMHGTTVAACSHGDVIPQVIKAAVARGAKLDGPQSPKKGSRYVLEVVDGTVKSIVHFATTD